MFKEGLIIGGGIVVLLIFVILITHALGKNNHRKENKHQDQVQIQPKSASDKLLDRMKAMTCLKGRVYKNLFIPVENDDVRVIPMLLVDDRGISVFQYVELEGWVLGREESRWWTYFRSSDDKNFINNPIWTNDEVIDDLMNFFPKTKRENYHSYVIFSDQCELRFVEPWRNTRVLNAKYLEQVLENDIQVGSVIWSSELCYQMERIFDVMMTFENLEERLDSLKTEMIAEREARLKKKPSKNAQKSNRRLTRMKPEDCFTKQELALRDSLVLWRKQQANNLGISDFEIFDNRALDTIVSIKPVNLKGLALVPGMDEEKVAAFGAAITSMVEHMPEKKMSMGSWQV